MHLIRHALLLTFCCLLAAADTAANEEKLHADLMDADAKAGNASGYVQQVLWFVENRPDSKQLLGRGNMTAKGGRFNTPADYQQVKAAWEVQVNLHSDSGAVLLNAALFMRTSDPERAVELLEQARKTTPPSAVYAETEARIFAGFFLLGLPKETADMLRSRLLASSDAELLCDTGSILNSAGGAENKAAGMDLIQKAVSLDPSNTSWQKALQQAQASATAPPVAMPGPVRIGPKIAEANLTSKVDPVYPALAKSAQVEGTVEFTAIIDENGAVQNLQLVRGHPLLVSAARDAVKQWQYRPTLLNGKAVAVNTTIDVPFRLSQ
jgi:TonB family protein